LIADSFDISIGVSDRHFKTKKNKSDIETLPKEEVINCSCASNQEDGLMIQVRIKQSNYIFYLLILFNITLFRSFNLQFCIKLPKYILFILKAYQQFTSYIV